MTGFDQSSGPETGVYPHGESSILNELNFASAVIQQSTFSDEDFCNAFRNQVTRLELNATILALDETTDNLVVYTTTHQMKHVRYLEKISGVTLKGFSFPLSGIDIIEKIIRDRKPIFLPDARELVIKAIPRAIQHLTDIITRTFGVMPTIIAPLLSLHKIKGVLTITGATLSPPDIAPVESFSHHLATAMENLKLFTTIKDNEAQLKKQADDMALINTLNEALNHKKSLDKILGHLVHETNRIFNSLPASIWFYDKKTHELVLQDTGLTPPIKEQIEILIGMPLGETRICVNQQSVYHKAISHITSQLSNDEKEIKGIIHEFIRNLSVRGKNMKDALSEFVPQLFKIIDVLSAIIVPLGTEDEPIGLIEVLRHDPFSGEDLKRFENIARQVTTVIKRKEDEEQLTKLSNAVEQSPAIVVITDIEGKIEYTNPKFTEVTGYTFAEITGQKLYTLFSAGTGDHNAIWDDVITRGEWKGEIARKKKNGEPFWEACSISTLKNDLGRAIHYLTVGMDITEQKRMEEEIFKIKNLESLGLLAGGIAHDFNNILTGILGNINLAKEIAGDRESELYQILIEGEKAAVIAKDLTQQLLTFAKGGAPIKQTSSLITLIKETVSFELRGSKIEWNFDYPEDLYQVDIDRTQIAQVISNLVINAEQAIADEKGTIELSAHNISKNDSSGLPLPAGRYVKISIKDNGSGIEKQYLDRIFNPYFTTKESGSGLGLATAYSIVKRHGGLIVVDSEPGKGSVFTIHLPAASDRRKTKRKHSNESADRTAKVLLVDDEEVVRKVGTRLLRHLGFEVESACTGEEAINLHKRAKTEGKKFNAVILDLTLPGGMGGKDILHLMRQTDPKLKAIASSGYSSDGVMSSYGEYGFDGIVMKPYKIEELGSILRSTLTKD